MVQPTGLIKVRRELEFSAAQKPTRWWQVATCFVVAVVGIVIVSFSWRAASPAGILAWEFGFPVDDARLDALRASLAADSRLIIGYMMAAGGLTMMGRYLAFTRDFRRVAWVGFGSAMAAGIMDFIENACLAGDWTVGELRLTALAATVKFSLLIPAVVIAIWSIGSLGRALKSRWWIRGHGGCTWNELTANKSGFWARCGRVLRRLPAEAGAGVPSTGAKSPDAVPEGSPPEAADRTPGSDESRWRRAYLTPDVSPGRRTAICLSGGGIRSASVALGAMQRLTRNNPDRRSVDVGPDYIVSVSGGGFTAGAFLQSLGRNSFDPGEAEVLAEKNLIEQPLTMQTAFGEGTEEYEHIRRHSSYIADSPAEMLTALMIVAKNMVLSLTLLFAPAVLAGVLAGIGYAVIPVSAIAPVPGIAAPSSPTGEGSLSLYANWEPTKWVLGGFLALAVVLMVVAGVVEALTTDPRGERTRVAFMWAAIGILVAAGLIAIVTVGAPGLMRVASAVLASSPGGIAWSVSAVALLNYVAVLVAILWRNRGIASRVLAALRGKATGARSAVPRGVIQLVIVLFTLAVVTITWFLTFGGVGAWTFQNVVDRPSDALTLLDPTVTPIESHWSPVCWVGAIALVVTILLACYDVTSSSLHPFYRRRLARTFAVRRFVNRADPSAGALAIAYRPKESTELTLFDHDPATTPHFVFAAAANLSGAEKPAPGLNAISYCFGTDFVGSPDLGWVSTKSLQVLAPPRIKRDLTVQASVAVSGAAFASAMGRASKGFEKLLALSGARLGTWLPNPMFLSASTSAQRDNWAWPHGLPIWRGAGYFIRELLGINSARGRLVQITDGGHYENLGLVEALRRRCSTIICIDSSGDAPPNLSTLSDAIRLARAELGVTITFPENRVPTGEGEAPVTLKPQSDDLAPGTGTPFDPDDSFADLNARITKSCVLVGEIVYPRAAFDSPPTKEEQRATLILAKAVLWQGCPPWLMTYANTNAVFPHDSTSDQWFNESQFAAYTELGRRIGSEAARVWKHCRDKPAAEATR